MNYQKVPPIIPSQGGDPCNGNTNNEQYDHPMHQPLVPQSDLLECLDQNNAMDEENEMICRICLEGDDRECMIAPCLCSGSSKWVHRHCLDQWRVNQEDRAFSKCTECLFEYQMEVTNKDRRRRIKYCLYVTRDVTCFTLIVQAIIAMLALFVKIVDVAEDFPYQWMGCQYDDTNGTETIDNSTATTRINDKEMSFSTEYTPFCYYSTYYVSGLVLFLIVLGLYGSIILCQNRCSVHNAMNHHHRHHDHTSSRATQSAPRGAAISSSARTGPADSHYYRRTPQCHCGDCYVCVDCCSGCDDCCRCCDCDGAGCNHASGGGGGGSDGAHILFLILAVIAIVLAMIGAAVGFLIAIAVTQRSIQRHLFRLQKQRLVSEYRVKDLSRYNNLDTFRYNQNYQDSGNRDSIEQNERITGDDGNNGSCGKCFVDDVENRDQQHEYQNPGIDIDVPSATDIRLSSSTLPAADVSHLKKLGLMD